ncbi:MAG: hypothetical protein AABW99_00465 [archaeon]
MKSGKEKGQIFSIDFVIAAALIVLAMGMLLNFYDYSSNEAKENSVQAELNAIALTASNLALENSPCTPTGFETQGYSLEGCSNANTAIQGATKQDLMIPEGINCNVRSSDPDGSNSLQMGQCSQAAGEQDVTSIQRNFVSPAGGTIDKTTYEKCVNGNPAICPAKKVLQVAIWK